MCGRVSMLAAPELLLQLFGVPAVPDLGGPQFNTAPSDPLLTITNRGEGRQAEAMRWGLVPPWAKDVKIGYRMINARSETVATKNSFRSPFAKRRCLIVVDGFYEWQREGKSKLPWRIVMDGDTPEERGRPYALAGLWERWKQPDESWLITATILTTEANALLERIHDRMPVILPEPTWDTWLDPDNHDTDSMQDLLVPYEADALAMFRVSTHVNNARHKDALCAAPLAGEGSELVRGREL